jgi:MFS family permease
MNTRKHIEELFSGYEETAELGEFMEEMESNLNDRIASLRRGGLGEREATDKALAELGDISSLADELSIKRKQEVFSEMYMKTRNYISAKRSALYALCGLVLGAAILIPLIVWFAAGTAVAAVSTILPFGMASVLGFVYLGLTQETAAHEGMRSGRACLYVLAVGLVFFGILAGLIVYSTTGEVSVAEMAAYGMGGNEFIVGGIGTLLVFTLPGIALGIFLVLTEKDRRKPWMKKLIEESERQARNPFGNPLAETRFGLISGALWIAAVAGFILLTLTVGIKFSWLSIAAALVVQMVVMAVMMNRGKEAGR